MKNSYTFQSKKLSFLLFFLIVVFTVHTQDLDPMSSAQYSEYSGIIVDGKSGEPLVFASLTISETNISTITNTDGEFLLKVPENSLNANISISFLGYLQKTIAIAELKNKKNRIELMPTVTQLSEINVKLPANAKELVKSTLRKKSENNLDESTLMTAFYRETIKKRRKNVSLAEAIVNVYKQPYTSTRKDYIKLYKARKSTDYTKLDTVALKLQGGPFNALYIDLMKYPEYIFTEDVIDLYKFSFGPSTTINERPVYVVMFKQRKDIQEPLYYGKLYIDSETLALTSAVYNLNVENRELTSRLFVRKKPRNIKVYPTEAAYRVDYREKNGKWYYGYSNAQLTFKINRKGKLFNSIYSLSSEMAITDWELNTTDQSLKFKERLKPSVVISDEASGFSDPEFWGAFNVIEPEKSIESAINKIKKQLKKAEKS